MCMNITFSNINIASISANSGVFTGTNSQINWQINRKCNSGLGKMIGYQNVAAQVVNIIDDNDLIDANFSQYQKENNQVVTQS